MCTSDTSCVLGATPTLALLVAVVTPPEASGAAVSAPFEDPPDATERSCGLGVANPGHAGTAWAALLATLILLRRRRAPVRLPKG
jgi:MYXO-CTERM domain-containing protein